MNGTAVSPKVARLLDITSSQHGFWLINHAELIADELLDGINKHGMAAMVAELNDYRGVYTAALYRKIKAYRSTL